MKKITLASAILFVMMAFVCQKSIAQSKKDQKQPANSQPDPNASTQATPDASQSADPNAATESNKVTIDSTATAPAPESSAPASSSGKTESTTKIHIYSGKHDGNNVINPDPKN